VYDQAKFVLTKYSRRASPEEREAVTRLVERLRVLSGRPDR
jgi:ABC-type transporter MlaC component